MQFGDVEWFKKVEEVNQFPGVFAFYLTDSGSIVGGEIESKVLGIDNIKYSEVSPSGGLALLKVVNIRDVTDYYETICELKKDWNQ